MHFFMILNILLKETNEVQQFPDFAGWISITLTILLNRAINNIVTSSVFGWFENIFCIIIFRETKTAATTRIRKLKIRLDYQNSKRAQFLIETGQQCTLITQDGLIEICLQWIFKHLDLIGCSRSLSTGLFYNM